MQYLARLILATPDSKQELNFSIIWHFNLYNVTQLSLRNLATTKNHTQTELTCQTRNRAHTLLAF